MARVEISGDLQIARVYLTVPGGEAAERRTLAAVRHAGGYIQRMVASELTIRQCPELRFDIDERAKRVRETMQLLEANRRNRPELFEEENAPPDPGNNAGHGAADDENGSPETSERVEE